MNFITDPIRLILRDFLGIFTELTIKKHHIYVIGIVDLIHPNQSRDYIYRLLSDSDYVCRKNIEETTAEFSIPLSILGYNYYPDNIIEWIKLCFKILIGYFLIKPYKHSVIIDLHFINDELLRYWLKKIYPQIIFSSSNFDTSDLSTSFVNSQQVKLPDSSGEFDEKIKKAIFDSLKIRFQKLSDPKLDDVKPKYRILRGKNQKMLIDARYHYYPYNIKSIIEVANVLGQKAILISKIPLSKSLTKDDGSSYINIKEYNEIRNNRSLIEEYDVIIFYGKFDTMSEIIKDLSANPLEV